MERCNKRLKIVFAGHVDHGKSSVIGRLLFETKTIPKEQLAAIEDYCARNARPFEYAFLLDALAAERAQGVTIDAARAVLRTAAREYAIVDVPGHSDFIRNMVSGASHADLGCLVVDATEGLCENSRRHAYLLSFLGVCETVLVVNKMELVSYAQPVFEGIVQEFAALASAVGLRLRASIPVSAINGDNLFDSSLSMNPAVQPSVPPGRSGNMPWYTGHTLLSVLESFTIDDEPDESSARMFVQDVYKFTENNDRRRIIAGSLISGKLRAGDHVVFYPSARRGRIRSLEGCFPAPGIPLSVIPEAVQAGESCGLTLEEETFVTRGQLMVSVTGEVPEVSTLFEAQLFWLGPSDFDRSTELSIKLGSAKTPVRLVELREAMDLATLEARPNAVSLKQYELGRCVLKTLKELAFSKFVSCAEASRFVLVGSHRICGAGICIEALADEQSSLREKLVRRQCKWERSLIQPRDRALRFGQKPALVLFSGAGSLERKAVAKLVEANLFSAGRTVYFLGMGNLLYGIDADIQPGDGRPEHMRRLAEVANLMLDAGLILLVSAADLRDSDMQIIRTLTEPHDICSVLLGREPKTELGADLTLPDPGDHLTAIRAVRELLEDRQIIFRCW